MANNYSVLASQQMLIYASSATTDATGALTVTLPAGLFTAVYAVTAVAIRDTVTPATACFALVRSFSATTVIVQVFESASTTMKNGAVAEGLALSTTATPVQVTVFGV